MTMAPCSWASPATSTGWGVSTKPVCAKFDGWTRRTTVARPSASGASKSEARVRFVVPTSISRAPVRRTISGMRTPPPISTSSPRETATPCLPASPTASTSAAALLTVTSASSAPVSAIRWSSTARNRGPRRPASRSNSSSEYAAGGTCRRLDRGLRPRRAAEVRVQDHPGGVEDRGQATPRRVREAVEAIADSRGQRIRRSSASSPAASRARSSATTSRATAATASAAAPSASGGRTAASSRSTLGGRGRSVDIGPPWRERVGVEPTAPRRAPRHWF